MNVGVTLRDEDRRAVDMLLDRTQRVSGNGDGGQVFVSGDGVSPERLDRAGRLLGMLNLLPQAEPPQDLLARTLRRLDEPAAAAAAGMMEPRHPLAVDAQQQAHA